MCVCVGDSHASNAVALGFTGRLGRTVTSRVELAPHGSIGVATELGVASSMSTLFLFPLVVVLLLVLFLVGVVLLPLFLFDVFFFFFLLLFLPGPFSFRGKSLSSACTNLATALVMA